MVIYWILLVVFFFFTIMISSLSVTFHWSMSLMWWSTELLWHNIYQNLFSSHNPLCDDVELKPKIFIRLLEDTPFIIPKNWIYTKGASWKDTFPQFHKILHVLKVSLEETPSAIWKFWIYTVSVLWIWFYIKGVSWRDTFYNSKKKLNLY